MDKPWHGSQYPVNRSIDRSNRFGAECKFAFTWPSGTNGDAWEAVNGILVPKTGTTDSTLDTSPLGVGVYCEAGGGDSSRSHTYPIPSAITYTSTYPENFVVSFYASAQGGSFLNLIGNNAANSTMRFRSTGDTLFVQFDDASGSSLTHTTGLTGAGADFHLFTIVMDHTNGNLDLYVDGVFDATTAAAAQSFTFNDILSGVSATGYGWSGYAQELQVFITPTPWAAADVAAHAENMFQIYESANLFPYLVSSAAAAAGGLGIPIAAYHYNHRLKT